MEFQEHLKKYLKDEEIDKLINSLTEKEKKSIIVNTNKIDDSFLLNYFSHLKKHPLVPHCYLYDEDEYQLGKHLFFEQGLYYIFEPCSSLVNYLLDPKEDDIVLDLCAAPGGKTTHLSLLKKNQGIIVSNEISKERALVLSSNVERMGLRNVVVTNNNIDDFKYFESSFDKIILDAPCSGSGMFRKSEKMKEDWSYSKVISLSSLQKELIIKAYSLLKPGGALVYSTCSFSYEEDEEVIKYLLENTNARLSSYQDSPYFFHSQENIGIHLLPFIFPGEGHYICKIEKPINENSLIINNKKIINNPKYEKVKSLCEVDGYIYSFDNIYYLIPHYFDFKNLRVLRGGLKLGTLEKYGFEFDHALSHYLTNFSKEIELSKEQALSYIEGNSLNINIREGITLVKYLDQPIGFAKSIKGRINNKYPKGLRKKLDLA